MRQVEDVDAELTPLAKWLLLSSPRRMETAPGFSPWGSVMPQCGTWCLALNSPINKLNQHLSTRAGLCRERCHAARSQIGKCSQLLTQEKQTLDEVYSGHTWMRMTLVRTCYVDWSHFRRQLQKSLPANRNGSSGRCVSRVETSARAVFTKSRLCGTEKHCQVSQQCPLETSADGPQIWWYDSMWSMWLNIVHCHHCPLRLPRGCFCRPRVEWWQLLDFHHGDQSCRSVERDA